MAGLVAEPGIGSPQLAADVRVAMVKPLTCTS